MNELTIIPNLQWRVIYHNNIIIQFTNQGETHTCQQHFIGSKEECEQFISNNGLVKDDIQNT